MAFKLSILHAEIITRYGTALLLQHKMKVGISNLIKIKLVNLQVAIDSKKRAYSWGFGGFGRLGHAEQKDEMVPRMMKFFDTSSRGVRSIFCGATFSLAINEIGVLYLFGQNKKTGEANMYPKPVQDLSGWHITSIGCSNTSVVISADDTLIAWGASPTFGELVS